MSDAGRHAVQDTVLACGSTVSGSIIVPGMVRVEGHVEGSIQAGGGVVVGASGRVDAGIRGAFAVVSGEVRGDIAVGGLLRIAEGALVLGDMEAERAEIAAGSRISGTLRVIGRGKTGTRLRSVS